MSSIPNLLSLRGSRGGSRGGARGGRRGGPGTADATIQGTDTDAAVSRLSAVDLGYLDDEFAGYFVQDVSAAPRRLPIINRGACVEHLWASSSRSADRTQEHTHARRH